jgi:hypothetical protein
MDLRTRPIVRLDVMNRMVTKGYRKGVYERVTKETEVVKRNAGNLPAVPRACSEPVEGGRALGADDFRAVVTVLI